MKHRLVVVGLVCLALILAAIAVWGWYVLATSPLRQALPWSAREVVDLTVDGPPDHGYFLRAKITEPEFRAYCERMRLTPHTSDRVYTDDEMWLSWDGPAGGRTPDWWNPSSGLDGTYVEQSGKVWTFAKYENGYLYVKSRRH
jgi:hypothetical protein